MPNNEAIEIRSEEVQEILTAVPNWMIRWGNTAVLFLILGLMAISWFVSYPDVITTEAIITTQQPPQKVYANATGTLQKLLVIDNERVMPGSPLAIIENTASDEDIFFLKSVIDTLHPSKEVFEFPINEMPLLFLGDIETSYANFENAYQAYVLNKNLKPYANESLANRSTISQLQFRLKNAQVKKELQTAEMQLRQNELDRASTLFEKGVISKQDYESKQSSYLQAENAFANNDANISQVRQNLSTARKTATGTNITNTRETISLLKQVHQTFNQLKAAIKNWEKTYVLQSQLEGRVTFLNVWNENQTVQQGDLVFTLIPSEHRSYIARLRTPARNSGKIKTGQTVQLSLQDFPENEFGVLEGTLTWISAVSDEEGFYMIEVSLPEQLITSYKKEITFKQEMQANGKIITEDLRLIERFFYQMKNIFKD